MLIRSNFYEVKESFLALSKLVALPDQISQGVSHI